MATTKTAPKKTPAPAKQDAPAKKTPGVIASIEEFLSKATKEKPITKEGIVERLAKRFPDREVTALTRTTQCQVPGRMSKERGINVVKTDDGFYIKK
ncbi:hypothetical protein Pan44_25100 [Caulifigura coniformis]|uniref:Uncharacterized protein n=1 Tax=Caulifigura coniformis TaxID=2527983 RepID=A0A517SEE9_9PLAN|nr:hypothetical protein [Caulifigura coniformis]QDT54477.1 hypothetical protein Pan44_25100 [Caulifigura coniformis]